MFYKSVKVLRKRLTDSLAKHGEVVALARKTGINRGTIDKWIAGESVPNLDFLDQLAEGLGATPWELIKPDNEESLEASISPMARKGTLLLSQMTEVGQEVAIAALESILEIEKRRAKR